MSSMFKKLLGGGDDDYQNESKEDGILEQISEATTLSWKNV
jgi:hypothetical protein